MPKGGVVEIRDAETGASLLPFQAHDGDINDVAFSPDGSMLATTGADGALKVWDPSTGELQHSIRESGVALNPTFSSDGSRVAASWRGNTTTVRIASVATNRVIQSTQVPRGLLALSPDLNRVAVIGRNSDRNSAIIELRTGHRTEFREFGDVVSWSPDGRYIATGDWNYGSVYDATGGPSSDSITERSSPAWAGVGARCAV